MRSRCDRSATSSRSASSSSPTRSPRRLKASATCFTSGGPSGLIRTDRSPSPKRPAASARASTGRTMVRASRSATKTAEATSVRPSAASTPQAAATPRRRIELGTSTRTTAVLSASSTTGTRTSMPPGAGAEKARPLRARARLSASRGSAAGSAPLVPTPAGSDGPPTSVPSARKITRRPLPPGTVDRTAASRAFVSWVRARTGASDWASSSDADRARSRARVRTRTARGMRKASATMIVVVAARATSRRLTAQPCSGATSFTPTPRTVCRYLGSAAVSPSFRRSHDRWTSTVRSAPP